MLHHERHHIQVEQYNFRINHYQTVMTLTYRGCKYDQETQAKADRAWWNLVHRPLNVLVYRNKRYFPFVTGGQIK
jgi:hypothetical protein